MILKKFELVMQISQPLITEQRVTQTSSSRYLHYANATHFENRTLTEGISYTNYTLTQITGQLKLWGGQRGTEANCAAKLTKKRGKNEQNKQTAPHCENKHA